MHRQNERILARHPEANVYRGASELDRKLTQLESWMLDNGGIAVLSPQLLDRLALEQARALGIPEDEALRAIRR